MLTPTPRGAQATVGPDRNAKPRRVWAPPLLPRPSTDILWTKLERRTRTCTLVPPRQMSGEFEARREQHLTSDARCPVPVKRCPAFSGLP